MFGVIFFKLLRVDACLLPNFRFRDTFTIVGVISFIAILRTVFNQMTFDVTTLANVTSARFAGSKTIKLHLWTHYLSNVATVKLCSRVCHHFN